MDTFLKICDIESIKENKKEQQIKEYNQKLYKEFMNEIGKKNEFEKLYKIVYIKNIKLDIKHLIDDINKENINKENDQLRKLKNNLFKKNNNDYDGYIELLNKHSERLNMLLDNYDNYDNDNLVHMYLYDFEEIVHPNYSNMKCIIRRIINFSVDIEFNKKNDTYIKSSKFDILIKSLFEVPCFENFNDIEEYEKLVSISKIILNYIDDFLYNNKHDILALPLYDELCNPKVVYKEIHDKFVLFGDNNEYNGILFNIKSISYYLYKKYGEENQKQFKIIDESMEIITENEISVECIIKMLYLLKDLTIKKYVEDRI